MQFINSFEGLINGIDGLEVLITYGRPKPPDAVPDISNFEERVKKELENLKYRGIGGIVTNVGYKNYLEDEDSWQRFVFGLKTAVELGMRIWIYDENGYPSGSAGGKVLRYYPELEALDSVFYFKQSSVKENLL